jgi:hypothetical protein
VQDPQAHGGDAGWEPDGREHGGEPLAVGRDDRRVVGDDGGLDELEGVVEVLACSGQLLVRIAGEGREASGQRRHGGIDDGAALGGERERRPVVDRRRGEGWRRCEP